MAETAFVYRDGESNINQFTRTGRFFTRSRHWYFKTREGLDYGPFESRTECRYAFNEFLDVVSNQSALITEPLDYESSSTEWKMPKINFG